MIDYLKEVAGNSITPNTERPPKPSDNPITVSKTTDVDPNMDILANGASEGNRNGMATKLIGHLFGKEHGLIGSYDRTDNDPIAKEYIVLRTGPGTKKDCVWLIIEFDGLTGSADTLFIQYPFVIQNINRRLQVPQFFSLKKKNGSRLPEQHAEQRDPRNCEKIRPHIQKFLHINKKATRLGAKNELIGDG